uniref:Plectin/eS10 N-terminal domain-containing protein n=1 Tax=Chelonoidis abingdonii TaxID=106734 RepID=A0A8C0H7C1_CHEAB
MARLQTSNLFKEGVMVAKEDVHMAKPPELADNVPNRHVMKAMSSLLGAAPRQADRGPKVWKVNALLASLGERLTDTYRRSTAPLSAGKKAEAGTGAATEFQFRGGFGGRGEIAQ